MSAQPTEDVAYGGGVVVKDAPGVDVEYRGVSGTVTGTWHGLHMVELDGEGVAIGFHHSELEWGVL